ncbi:MAG: RNA polymerase sigma-70 factor [Chitinophagales bacterium]
MLINVLDFLFTHYSTAILNSFLPLIFEPRMLINSENDLKEFYQKHYEASVRQAFRITNDLPVAEDLVQDCMVKLWERRIELSQKEDLVFYFKRMVRNISIDHLRKKYPLTDTPELSDVSEPFTNALEYSELSHSIDQIIDSLPEKCRQVFVLSRHEQMTYQQIADQLKISNKTVENQISKALKMLRSGLGEQLFSLFF